MKAFAVVAALLLWAVATSANAGPGVYLMMAPRHCMFDPNRPFDPPKIPCNEPGGLISDYNAPLHLWKQFRTYDSGQECQKDLYGFRRDAQMFREAREQVHREKTTGEETLEHWAMGKCVMADDPRLVVAPTPQAPAAKPPKAATAPPQPPVPPSQAEPPLRLGKSFDQGEPLCNDKFGFRLLLDETKDGSCVIHYTPGRPIIITAWLFHGPNENHSRHRWPAQLVLDTGADLTMIRPQVLAKAGVDLTRPVGSGTISGVGGKTTASYFIVDSIVVGTSDALRVRVAAYDIAGSNSDGVLGNDILRQFKISIDSAAGIVTLTPRLRVKR